MESHLTEPVVTESVEQRVRAVVVEEFGVEDARITLETAFEHDLGADSLDAVELAMALEETFGIDIPDEDIPKLVTVRAEVDYVQARVRA